MKLIPNSKIVFIGLVIGLAIWGVLAAENHKRREQMLLGKWYRSSRTLAFTICDDGMVTDGDETSPWSYFNGKVTMSPQSGYDRVYILSVDGKHLAGEVVTDLQYEKRP